MQKYFGIIIIEFNLVIHKGSIYSSSPIHTRETLHIPYRSVFAPLILSLRLFLHLLFEVYTFGRPCREDKESHDQYVFRTLPPSSKLLADGQCYSSKLLDSHCIHIAPHRGQKPDHTSNNYPVPFSFHLCLSSIL